VPQVLRTENAKSLGVLCMGHISDRNERGRARLLGALLLLLGTLTLMVIMPTVMI
jgi:hypothetical protein